MQIVLAILASLLFLGLGWNVGMAIGVNQSRTLAWIMILGGVMGLAWIIFGSLDPTLRGVFGLILFGLVTGLGLGLILQSRGQARQATVGDALFGGTVSAPHQPTLLEAMKMVQAGKLGEAAKILEIAVAKMPSSSQCLGAIAEHKFELLLLLAEVTKRWTKDAQKELYVLDDCLPLIDKLQPPPPGPDRLFNWKYLLHMNRAVALKRLGRYPEEMEALTSALRAARDPETQCKCLAYLGLAILDQKDRAKLNQAWPYFDQFEHEAIGKDIPPTLWATVKSGRAIQFLCQGNFSKARRSFEEAYRLDKSVLAPELLQLLRRPDVTSEEVLEFILKWPGSRAREPIKSQELPPLPPGV